MLTRGLLTACKESRAAVERSRRYAQNTPRIITSKLHGRVQELFYCESSDIIILRLGWGRTGHSVSNCLAIPESDKRHFGIPPHFPKHIGLEIDLDDYFWLLKWENSPSNRSQQHEHLRHFVDSMMDWVNHGATLHFICPSEKLYTDYQWIERRNLQLRQVEGPVFSDNMYKYLPVLPSSCLETWLVAFFITHLKTIFQDICKLDSCVELCSSLKLLGRQNISHDKTTD
ncbi:hypothetical protein K456DRAFT_31709 [Colletotrichum gloeosporioides 23]|nr:hypothetical protein K456DRAFT_31709 [Colletotrichum gloeosporioides 23]